jgi:hypothetical protein
MSQLTNVMDGAPPPVTPALPFQFGYTSWSPITEPSSLQGASCTP